ncbi:MAG: heparan-alpha-glucosaminide N-acetyltransferase domain-containing protein [Candidatus Izemoplasmatales bacterium]
MKKQVFGLDVLRGVGIFSVLILHTAFYYFDGIYDLDLSNPPLIITLIGFVLMFAGLFAMISGFVHTLSVARKIKEQGFSYKMVMKYSLFAGLYVLVIAYLYFLFTGPGIIHFESRSMDQSLLVELIKSGRFILPSLDRILYIDSLVMIGTNVILVGLITVGAYKFIKDDKKRTWFFYLLATLILLLSAFRIPLYAIYLNARDEGNYFVVIALNFFVNKNNPIFPFLAFGLFGSFMASLMLENNPKKMKQTILPSGILFFVAGLVIYLTAEETMLDRMIDYTWYGIMVFQIGLFQLLIYLFISIYDKTNTARKPLSFISKFFYRFGIAGLTVFFIEQLFSSFVKQILLWIQPGLQLEMYTSIFLGLVIALFWGTMLILWEKVHYAYGIEYGYTRFMARFGGSEKRHKLEE